MIEPDTIARIVQPSNDLNADIEFFQRIGFQLHQIFPADDPKVAILYGHDLNLQLDRNARFSPSDIILLSDHSTEFGEIGTSLRAPNGCTVKFERRSFQLRYPITQHRFAVRKLRDEEPWVIGRAGMQYRDLIPDRLGGSIIASHIRIPTGGPVPDMVHYHTIGFQLVFCYQGWVRLVYEDQGPPFILQAGECVTQPPEIRHRVLEASDNLEVIEIGVPSDHMTTIDHDLKLPTEQLLPERLFGGQRFCRHQLSEATWLDSKWDGFEERDTGVAAATNGLASVLVRRANKHKFEEIRSEHEADILFTFVMRGEVTIRADQEIHQVKTGEAYVVPPKFPYQIYNPSPDLEILEVSLAKIS